MCLLMTAMAALACDVPVASNLDDREANRIFVALDRASVDATKEPDPASEGRWRIGVTRDDLSRALAVLRDEQLPRVDPPSVAEAVGKGALVPSEASEHAQLVAGLAGDLERSLEGIDGVMRARVHLSIPAPTPLRDATPMRGTASVLIEHRGSTPPLSADSVERLIAGAVAGLQPSDVAVILLSRPSRAAGSEALGLTYLGPIAVARTSMRRLQAALATLMAMVTLLAAAALTLYLRLARARAALSSDANAAR